MPTPELLLSIIKTMHPVHMMYLNCECERKTKILCTRKIWIYLKHCRSFGDVITYLRNPTAAFTGPIHLVPNAKEIYVNV